MKKIMEVKEFLEILQLTITHQRSIEKKSPTHEEKEIV
jgi:hypothetical protein